MNIADLIIILLLLCAVLLAVRSILKSRKNGCSCGCGGCAFEGSCHKKAAGSPSRDR